MKPTLRILSAGLSTSIQDFGRHGFQRLGVSVGGALDPVSLRAANLLVGNPENTGALLFIAQMLEQRSRFTAALGTYRDLLILDPSNQQARLRIDSLSLKINHAGSKLIFSPVLRILVCRHE